MRRKPVTFADLEREVRRWLDVNLCISRLTDSRDVYGWFEIGRARTDGMMNMFLIATEHFDGANVPGGAFEPGLYRWKYLHDHASYVGTTLDELWSLSRDDWDPHHEHFRR